MTRKDFELIAAAIADVEERFPDEGENILREVVAELEARIAAEHPRFDAGRFSKAAMPIRSERLKASILAKLGQAS